MANPFMTNDPEEEKAYRRMIVSCIAGASLVVLFFLVMLYLNTSKKNRTPVTVPKKTETEEEEFVYGQSNLVSSDLDFWDMFDEDDKNISDEDEDKKIPYKKESAKKEKNSDKDKNESESMSKEPEKDPGSSDEENNDSNHLAVTDSNGKTTYYEILEDVQKNDYNFGAKLQKNESGRLSYVNDGKDAKTGVSLNKNSGDVDFGKVKSSGIDYCMVRIGSRGYSTGIVSLDEKFIDYATNAKNNNLQVGVYFDTAAVSEAEAVEEASFAAGAIGNYGIRYPIAINLDNSEKDGTSRDLKLTMKEKTSIAKAFCETVKQYNFNPVICAKRDTLITQLNLEDLNDYDIWITDFNNPTDYPYKFTMWSYTDDLSIDGVGGRIPVSLSFIDYAER